MGSGTVSYSSSSSYANGSWSATGTSYKTGSGHTYQNGLWYAYTISTATASSTAVLSTGAIKRNVSSIVVTLPTSTSATVNLFSANGTLLKSESVSYLHSGTVTINCSDIDTDDLEGCYATIVYSKSVTQTNTAYYSNWNTYPNAISFTTSTSITSVKVIY